MLHDHDQVDREPAKPAIGQVLLYVPAYRSQGESLGRSSRWTAHSHGKGRKSIPPYLSGHAASCVPQWLKRSRRRSPKPDRRRALELLASCPDGCTEAIMLAHGFTIEQMVELVRTGLATLLPDANSPVGAGLSRRPLCAVLHRNGGMRS
jgi:hypothetical protein